jgi:hypothetical protein
MTSRSSLLTAISLLGVLTVAHQADAQARPDAWYRLYVAGKQPSCVVAPEGPAEELNRDAGLVAKLNRDAGVTNNEAHGDDVRDPKTGAVVETTILVRSPTAGIPDFVSFGTFYRGFARCEAVRVARSKQAQAATDAQHAAAQAAIGRYGAQPTP